MCRRLFFREFFSIFIGVIVDKYSGSSLLSECTSGLVGALKIKLDENEEDIEGAGDRLCESGIGRDAAGNCDSC